jgi:hypothetical protein
MSSLTGFLYSHIQRSARSIENTSVNTSRLSLSAQHTMVFLGDNVHISVQIVGFEIELPNDNAREQLARFTNMFIQKYAIHDVSDLSPTEVKLIKDNYGRMAHKWQPDTGITKIAASRKVMNELFPTLSSKKIVQAGTIAATNKSPTTQSSATARSGNNDR